ncbi:LysR substrate-binding domain-containing protein [Roseospirillum parvum]|uniref:DNA-binding transcriptional regulator, LysR family n=1 Tax=Roseospirillum parvum TaxID=83401 RepID=A0A1G7X4F0_9PROT|nr:LysR substrate-binding domain-containing protein [Roseospirillum parvum]SDG79089.1 DNA-binding transcriptional regulator, LysR family [Roseospirillum parvum]
MGPAFDIDALRAVVAGIDLRSFARAAVALGRSQSAVSMQLKKLERQAGTQLFVRKGRGLVPTEAGEALAAYARRIIALNDEAARALGAAVTSETVRLGLPQDFFDDVMPATLAAFASDHPDVHVEVRAGPNHTLGEEIRAGRLDGAIVFFPRRAGGEGELLCELPMHWLAHTAFADIPAQTRVPLVMFDHPCLFRQATLAKLDQVGRRWRIAVTTPSLPGIWGALRSGLGIAVRTGHGVPDDIIRVGDGLCLPSLPVIELRMLRSQNATPAAQALCQALQRETLDRVTPH